MNVLRPKRIRTLVYLPVTGAHPVAASRAVDSLSGVYLPSSRSLSLSLSLSLSPGALLTW